MNKQEALDKKAENARELGLDYEPLEAKDEPVAVWELFEDGWDSIADPEWMESLPVGTRLYTTPPQRKPLSDEEIDAIVVDEVGLDADADEMHNFARAIEAAHCIKGEA